METEIRRIYITFVKIYRSYFRLRDIPVVYSPATEQKKNTVIIPKIDLEEMNRMRPLFEHKTEPYRFEVPNKVIQEKLMNIYQPFHNSVFPDAPIINEWSRHGKLILKTIDEIIPQKLKKIKTIVIFLTHFGTRASFELCKPNDTKITIYLRTDAQMYDLVFSILSSLLRHDLLKRHHNTWEEAQLLADWFISDTKLATVFKEIGCDDYKTLLSNIRVGYGREISQESKKIYEALEIGRVETGFFLLNGEVLYKGKMISGLSFGENRILTALIENKEGVLTYEVIGDLVLQKEEKFSLYSISKRVQRLRDKLEEMGIGKHHIQTVRGVGFRMK
ncbi:hypothetical protein COY16_02740 [Candidatus Roizmanbacteria bacterium CG_4_10_14_0_2_um_filter_39_13]|uniref:OmpR/PhoB-type domain-containing protein n=2 Tax=Candidatus Roizmaniibacteriota TaxID=1752723 RepID=A0A2M7TZ81_9BACT|nr:MAG: hypothetical protein COY16_02740 [Candidatus Roizmanbacteria bacterium CG_4_10_14_0_2_um_filter_39_13]